jgi:hypothetical protein
MTISGLKKEFYLTMTSSRYNPATFKPSSSKIINLDRKRPILSAADWQTFLKNLWIEKISSKISEGVLMA